MCVPAADPAFDPAPPVAPGPGADSWIALVGGPLPSDVSAWAVRSDCGALVTFCGTVRDHADGRAGVERLTYEAYAEVAVARMEEIAVSARQRWPEIGRVALLHRVGELALGEVAVVVAVSAPHREAAFDAARWCIDTVKSAVPIWKHERWSGGEGWGTGAQPIEGVPTDPAERPAVSAAS